MKANLYTIKSDTYIFLIFSQMSCQESFNLIIIFTLFIYLVLRVLCNYYDLQFCVL